MRKIAAALFAVFFSGMLCLHVTSVFAANSSASYPLQIDYTLVPLQMEASVQPVYGSSGVRNVYDILRSRTHLSDYTMIIYWKTTCGLCKQFFEQLYNNQDLWNDPNVKMIFIEGSPLQDLTGATLEEKRQTVQTAFEEKMPDGANPSQLNSFFDGNTSLWRTYSAAYRNTLMPRSFPIVALFKGNGTDITIRSASDALTPPPGVTASTPLADAYSNHVEELKEIDHAANPQPEEPSEPTPSEPNEHSLLVLASYQDKNTMLKCKILTSTFPTQADLDEVTPSREENLTFRLFELHRDTYAYQKEHTLPPTISEPQ